MSESRVVRALEVEVDKLNKRIAELEAENKKLIEGQQAKLEAGS